MREKERERERERERWRYIGREDREKREGYAGCFINPSPRLYFVYFS